jgi:hypothetical protein
VPYAYLKHAFSEAYLLLPDAAIWAAMASASRAASNKIEKKC